MNNDTVNNSMSEREMLLELREKLNDMEKRQHRFCVAIISILAGIALIACIAAIILVPKFSAALDDCRTLVTELEPLVDDLSQLDFDRLEENLASVSKAAEEISKVDFETLNEKISELDIETINDKLKELDIEALNQTINNLNKAVDTLSNLFG